MSVLSALGLKKDPDFNTIVSGLSTMIDQLIDLAQRRNARIEEIAAEQAVLDSERDDAEADVSRANSVRAKLEDLLSD